MLLARPLDSSRPKPRFIRSAFYTQRYQVRCACVVNGLRMLRLATRLLCSSVAHFKGTCPNAMRC